MRSLLMVALMAVAAWAGPNGTVVRPVANMYSAATTDADVVSQAIYATPVGVVEQKGSWLKIQTPDEYAGWVPAADVRLLHEGERTYAAQGRVAQIQALFSHLYREPDLTKHAPLLTVPFETKLEVVQEPQAEERWLQVRLPDDRSAWVQRGDLTFSDVKLSVPEMIALSKRFLGLPYTWGGTSSFGYDCSGFTQMLCRQRGINLPRDAGPQAAWDGVKPIPKEQLQAGDLLYFGAAADKITHTGLYIGNDQFIHATTHDRPVVQISHLSEPVWTKLLVATRRPK